MNASSNVSQLDALHLELLHAAIPQQYDTIGVMMPGVAGRIGCRASAYRSAAKRLCRSGAGNVESVLAAFLTLTDSPESVTCADVRRAGDMCRKFCGR